MSYNIVKSKSSYENNYKRKRSSSPNNKRVTRRLDRQTSCSRDGDNYSTLATPLSVYSFDSYYSSNTNPDNISINSSTYLSNKLLSKQSYHSTRQFIDLPLEFWERSERCKEAKLKHMDKVDRMFNSREELVLLTSLWNTHTILEPNMFPYLTPKGIEHYTLWSRKDLSHEEIVRYVDNWLIENFPKVKRWQYDDNCGERSIELFHVHVYIEMEPFSFIPREKMEYFPPHMTIDRKLA